MKIKSKTHTEFFQEQNSAMLHQQLDTNFQNSKYKS